jgi:aldose sugar dehydrogenase
MRYSLLLVTLSLAAMLVLATPLGYNIFANAQEAEDHEHAEHAAKADGPSVEDSNLAVEKIVDDLRQPTTMAFLDKDRMLVLEKDNGTVRMVKDGKLQPEPLLDVAVANDNERGMLGIAISKDNGTTYVFLYLTESGGGADGDDKKGVAPAGNRLYRYELQGDHLVNPKMLLDLPALPGPRYNGGPVAVGPDGFVYIIIGDVEGHNSTAQNFQNHSAADGTSGVLRVGKNGQVPPSIIGSGTFGKYYYAYGIRNSFGLAFDPKTDKLWDTENGPAFGDEINLVEPGFNSGWRDVQGMASPEDLTGLVLYNSRSHYSNPEFTWNNTVGPTALDFLNSSKLGQKYQDNMFVGDINNGTLYHFELNGNRTGLDLNGDLADLVADTPQETKGVTFGTGFGGITDIKTGPDGYLYVLSFVEGAIYRIAPADVSAGTSAEVQQEQKEQHEETSTTADLTVESADLSGNAITGMHTTIKADNGTVVEDGFTPVKFTGKEGDEYTVTVDDFRDRKFDHWDNNDTDREKTVTLDHDTTITAHYDIHSAAADDSKHTIIDRLDNLLNSDNCDDKDRHSIGKTVNKIIKDIFGNDRGDSLDKILKLSPECAGDIREHNNGGNDNQEN